MVRSRAAAAASRNWLEIQILLPYTRPHEPETLGIGPAVVFKHTLQVFLTHTEV